MSEHHTQKREVPLIRLLQSAVEIILRDVDRHLTARGWTGTRPAWGFVMGRMDIGPTTVNDLAAYLDVSKQAASKTIEQMEARGLVRLVPFPGDGRKKMLQYTDEGKRFRRETLEIVDQIERSWTAIIGVDGLATLREHTAAIVRANEDRSFMASDLLT